jgi:multidrug efflux pump subunit AcrA (membrane-fusion protein)
LTLILLAALLSACGSAAATPEPATAPRSAARGTIVAEGRLLPAQSAALAFAVGGTVVAVQVAEGDQVAAGQPLVALDDAAQQAALARRRPAPQQRGPPWLC